MTLEQNVADLTAANIKLTNEVLETKAKATVSADSALLNADRAVAAQGAITDELSRVLAAAEQVAADKELVESTKIGDEDYIVSAVVKLLGYTGVVDTALSDDVWAEHAWKWGGPSQVLAVALNDRVELRDMTKPSLPVISVYSFWSGANPITCVEFCGAALFAGSSNEFVGLHIFDFADGVTHRIKNGAATKAPLGAAPSNSSPVSEFPLFGSGMFNINAVAARIAVDAAHHPVSGVPMPTVAVGTDGGVSLLHPADGSWDVANITGFNQPVRFVEFLESGGLACSGDYNAHMDVYDPLPKVNVTSGTLARGYAENTVISTGDGGTTIRECASGKNGALLVDTNEPYLLSIHENPADSNKGMVARISEGYATPYMSGDAHCSLLCDGAEGVIAGGDVKAPTIPPLYDSFVTEVSGVYKFNTPGDWCQLDVASGLAEDDLFEVGVTISNYVSGGLKLGGTSKINFNDVLSGNGSHVVAAQVSPTGILGLGRNGATQLDVVVDYVRPLLADRSGRNNHAIINGTLNFSKPAGSDVAVASGFADAGAKRPQNCIRKKFVPGNAIVVSAVIKNGPDGAADYDIPFHVFSGWDGSPADPFKTYLKLQNDSAGAIRAIGYKSDRGVLIHTGSVAKEFTPVTVVLTSSVFTFYVNGQIIAEWEGATDLPDEEVEVLVGTGLDGSGSANWNGDIGPVVIGDTVPSADQIRDMHLIMKMQLKKPSFLTGSVRAVAHDSVRNQAWVACSDNQLHRYDGPVIMESVTVPAEVGTINALTVSDGVIAVGGSADAWAHRPAINLPAPVVKKGKSVQPFELGEGDSSTTDFYLPYGWKPVRAVVDGKQKRKGPQDDWQPMFDGYRWFVRFAVAPGSVDIDCDATEV